MDATYSRCQLVFAHDAPELHERFDRGYRELLADLGITSFADLRRRRGQIEQFVPQLWAVTESIISANPEIDHD